MQQMQAQAQAHAQQNEAGGYMARMGAQGGVATASNSPPAGGGLAGGVVGGLTKKFGAVGAIIGGLVVGAVALGGVLLKDTLKDRFLPEKGYVKWSTIGTESSAADGDKLMLGVKSAAQRWNKDAVWWSTNLQAVRADGTVDIGQGAQVQYISPTKVASAAASVRKDSIKKFKFSDKGADYRDVWGAQKPWTGVTPPELPACGIKQLMSEVVKTTSLPQGKTVRVSYSPKWEYASPVDEQAWEVTSEALKLRAWYSMASCKLLLRK